MHWAHPTNPPPLEERANGVICVSGTRISLERVIGAFLAGGTPEQIAQDFDSLSIQQVYAVVNFYLQNRDEVDGYLALADQDATAVRGRVENQFDPVGIRARLLSRRQ
jgi:uncharacterized protein (DUF433 family)